jgi:hypothetical protein
VETGIRAKRATHVISRKVKRADYVAETACIASNKGPITRVRRQRMELCDHPAIQRAQVACSRDVRHCRIQGPASTAGVWSLRRLVRGVFYASSESC